MDLEAAVRAVRQQLQGSPKFRSEVKKAGDGPGPLRQAFAEEDRNQEMIVDKAAAVRVFRGLGARVERAELLALSEAFGVVFPDGAVNPVTGRLRPHEMLAYPLLLMAVEGGAEDLAHRFHSRMKMEEEARELMLAQHAVP